MNLELFDARMLAPLVSFLDRHGAHSERLLDRMRIPRQLVDAGGWVTKKQAYDFTLNVVRRTDCPEAVFSAYREGFELAHIGPIADAMRSCKTVKESLGVATRLGNIAYEGSEYFLRSEGDVTWFCYREPQTVSAGQPFIIDMTLAVYYHLLRTAVGEDWRPLQLRTRGESIDRHRRVLNFEDCDAVVHPDYSALAFPTEFLSRRLPRQRQTVDIDPAQAWVSGPEGSEPIVDALYRLVTSVFSCRQLPTLDQVAWMAGTSPATLKRQLQAAGMSYRRLLDRVRFDAATEMLAEPQMPVHEIAHELGYSGTNNFVRSFRRMTGLTPGQYRNRQVMDAE